MKLLKNFLNLFCKKYQEVLEELMKGTEFIFGGVDLLEYKLNKINPDRKARSYIDSEKWLKNTKKQ